VAEEFGTAVYTNCAPGQGIEGVGGMQFQSHSPDVGREALAIIRRHLIYEPPERLIREREPIEAFPSSFGHVYEDGIFATAAGVYIGREADGTRPGNHLTHAIVTSNPGAYRSVRPAQLFRASFWRTKPTPATESEPLAGSWEPGPLDPAQVARFVNAQPGGAELLAALLAALLAHVKRDGGAEASRRILLISEDPDPALRWLAAATLLIPLPDALRIGFKVFTTDPARSATPVVAVHPDWARSVATVEDDRGYAVFDLTGNRWTTVPQPPEAQHWAKLFCEADPYDLSEAVELAAASGLSGDVACELGCAAVLGRTPSSANARALIDWLRTGPAALREAYSGRLIGVLMRLQDPALMRSIDDITRAQYPARRDETSLLLLRLELDDASRRKTPPGAVRRSHIGISRGQARRAVSPAAEPEAAQLVAGYLRQARGAAFDAILGVSAQFGVSVPLDSVREAATAFVAYWAENPSAGFDPLAWSQDPPIQDMLSDDLSERLLRRPSDATAIADGWWNRLPGWAPEQADIASPLHRALLSAAMARSDDRVRLRIVEANLSHINDPATGAHHRELADVLWARTSPTMGELRALCRLVPAAINLDPALFTGLVDRVTGESPSLAELELCHELVKKQLLAPNAATNRALGYHSELRSLESSLATANPAPGSEKLLVQAPWPLLAAHSDQLTRSMLVINDPEWATHLAGQLPPEIAGRYLGAWCEQSLWSFRPAQIAVSFALSRRINWAVPGAGSNLHFRLDVFLRDWCRKASARATGEVAMYLTPLGTGLVGSWNDLAERNRPGRFRRLRNRWGELLPLRRHPNV
jgi:GTPase-associated protein 1, C-terminal domain/GTPase-associated protein 1, N-terminal domain type 2/GTPase-associated protein 1, middle domain